MSTKPDQTPSWLSQTLADIGRANVPAKLKTRLSSAAMREDRAAFSSRGQVKKELKEADHVDPKVEATLDVESITEPNPVAAWYAQAVYDRLGKTLPHMPNLGLALRQAEGILSPGLIEQIRSLHRTSSGARHQRGFNAKIFNGPSLLAQLDKELKECALTVGARLFNLEKYSATSNDAIVDILERLDTLEHTFVNGGMPNHVDDALFHLKARFDIFEGLAGVGAEGFQTPPRIPRAWQAASASDVVEAGHKNILHRCFQPGRKYSVHAGTPKDHPAAFVSEGEIKNPKKRPGNFKGESKNPSDHPAAFEGEGVIYPDDHPVAFEGESKYPIDHPAAFEGEGKSKNPKNRPAAFGAESKNQEDHPAAFEGESKNPIDLPAAFEGEGESNPENCPAAVEGESKNPKDHPAAFEGESNRLAAFVGESKNPNDHPAALEGEGDSNPKNRPAAVRGESKI